MENYIKQLHNNYRNKVLLDYDKYANIINIGGQNIAICTDGVGSKALIAHKLGEYKTIGIDCVAMNVNDLLCVGAIPKSLVDYIAINHYDDKILEDIMEGLIIGAKQANITISGGETAELDFIEGFDLSGTAIGHIYSDRILIGKDIQIGDIIIGISSNGIHSNGLTKARRFIPEKSDIYKELLKPTHIYVKECLEIMANTYTLRGFAHITGGGFRNLLRLNKSVGYLLDNLPVPNSIFHLIYQLGKFTPYIMYSEYNMGIGMVLIISKSEVDKVISIIESHDEKKAYIIGKITSNSGYIEINNNPLNNSHFYLSP